MRRVSPWAIVLLLAALVAVGIWFFARSGPAPADGTGTAPTGIPAGATQATVSYVHDGDTLFLDAGAGDLKVRLIGIDSPELADDDTAQECYGPEAAAALRNLLPEGITVWTVHDREAQDQYGRELLYVFTEDGTLVNRAMVLAGAAEAIRIGQNDHYWPQLQDAQRDAETAGAGMWAVC